MKKLSKNFSPNLKSFSNNSLNPQNEFLFDKNSKLSKLIEETILEFNNKFKSITNKLNQLKQNLLQRLNNIQEISSDDISSLNHFGFQKNLNKSEIHFVSKSTRTYTKPDYMKISRNDSKKRRMNQNLKSLNFCDKTNSTFSPRIGKNQLYNNKKKVSRPNKPQLNYNNNKNNNINEKDKSKEKQLTQKNVSFNSNILVNNTSNNNANSLKNIKNQINLNSNDYLNNKKNEKTKITLDFLENTPILTMEEKIKNINNTYSNNIPILDNKILSDNKVSDISSSNSNKSDSMSISYDSENKKKIIFPSITSQIGINFITKEKEEEIFKDISNKTKKICELIYILLEKEAQFEENKDIKALFKYLFDAFNVDNIRDLFFKVIYPKVYISNSIDRGIYSEYNKIIINNLTEFKLICKATNQPLSWLVINILEFDKYFQLIFDK